MLPSPANQQSTSHNFTATELVQPLQATDCVGKTILTLADGETLYQQGQHGEHIYLVTHGHLKLSHQDAAGNASISAVLGSGEFCGNGLNGQVSCNETATAKGDTQLQRYTNSAFFALLAQSPQLVRPVMAALAQRQAASDLRLHALLTQDVRGRIAVVLHDLISRHGGRCSHGHEIDMPITHQELAELTGASRPVVSAALHQLREEGLLDYCRSFICINDLAALALLSSS